MNIFVRLTDQSEGHIYLHVLPLVECIQFQCGILFLPLINVIFYCSDHPLKIYDRFIVL